MINSMKFHAIKKQLKQAQEIPVAEEIKEQVEEEEPTPKETPRLE